MRIVSWNMGAFTPSLRASATREGAWGRLEALRPQPAVGLLQEATPHADSRPDEAGPIGSRIWTPALGLGEVRTLEGVGEHGRVAVGRLATDAGEVALISLHAKTEGSAIAHVEAVLEALSEDLSGSFVLAGDFNSARACEEAWPGYRHLEFFETAEERWGMVDCHWRLHGREQRTYFQNCDDGGRSFQDDHFFVSKDLAERVTACEVLDYEPFRGLSDHAPISLGLRLDAEGSRPE